MTESQMAWLRLVIAGLSPEELKRWDDRFYRLERAAMRRRKVIAEDNRATKNADTALDLVLHRNAAAYRHRDYADVLAAIDAERESRAAA